MSVTFSILSQENKNEDDYMNVNNANAYEILTTLDIPPGDHCYGQIRARDLVAKCNAYLANPTNENEIPSETEGRVIFCGRREGYMSMRVRELRELAIRAKDLGIICWG